MPLGRENEQSLEASNKVHSKHQERYKTQRGEFQTKHFINHMMFITSPLKLYIISFVILYLLQQKNLYCCFNLLILFVFTFLSFFKKSIISMSCVVFNHVYVYIFFFFHALFSIFFLLFGNLFCNSG